MTKYLAIMALVFILGGCSTVAKDYTASTSASYTNKDGTALKYDSTKNQENFKAHVAIDPRTGSITGLDIETSASTPEAAIAATANANARIAALLEKLLGMIPASAMAGS